MYVHYIILDALWVLAIPTLPKLGYFKLDSFIRLILRPTVKNK